MKPVLILQNLSTDGPAYLARWLRAMGQPFEVFDAAAGHAYPQGVEGYSALALLGGEMSANDSMPHLRQAERLFLQALQQGVPTLGHCLGGQLMARALGAEVTRAAVPEIGWHPMRIAPNDQARAWFGDDAEFTVFQWHYDTFALPPGAVSWAASEACARQAFGMGPHLAMQFHVELDLDKLRGWAAAVDPDFAKALPGAHVQTPRQMLEQAEHSLPRQQRLADRLYGRWLSLAA